MLSYPDNLPLPLREGYGFNPISPVSRSEMVSGRARQRLKYRSFPTMVTLSWVLDAKQARLFQGWFKWGVGYIDWFMCPIKSPMGLTPTRVRFTDIYSGPELVGEDHWRFSVPAELFEIPVIDEAEFTGLLAGLDLTVMNAELREQLEAWYTKNWPSAL